MNERIELLDQELVLIFEERAWYKPYGINEATARTWHMNFKRGKLSLEKKLFILFVVGRLGLVY